MKKALVHSIIWIIVSFSSALYAFEDVPFDFHVEVADSVLFVFQGVSYREFDLEYIPEELELFFNGIPVLKRSVSIDEEDCFDFLEGIETALRYLESGLPCAHACNRYENDQNALAWDIASWLENPNQFGRSDLWLTVQLHSFCRKSPVAPDIEGVFVLGGRGYIRFTLSPRQNFRWSRIPTKAEFLGLGSMRLPFRESMLRFSRQLIYAASLEGQHSHLFAVGSGGGSMTNSGVGVMPRGMKQLREITEQGKHVKGPIPPRLLW